MKKFLLICSLMLGVIGTYTIRANNSQLPQNQCKPNSPCYYSGPVCVEFTNGSTNHDSVYIDVKDNQYNQKIAIVTYSNVQGIKVGNTFYIYKGNYSVRGGYTYNYTFGCNGINMYFNGRF